MFFKVLSDILVERCESIEVTFLKGLVFVCLM